MIPGKQYTPEIVLGIAWRRKWLIVLPAIVIVSLVVGYTRYLPDLYRSDTLILVVPQRVPETYVRATVTTRIEDRLQSISQQILSRSRLERIIQEFNLYADRRKTEIMEDVVERMRKDIDVQVVKGDAFRVSFTAENPRTAMRVTEKLASFFIDESLRDREALAEGTNQFLESQLEDARRRLIDNEKRLEDYRRRHDGELPTQAEANMQGLHNTEMQLQALTESIRSDRDRRLLLERTLADNTPDLAAPLPVVGRGNGDDPGLTAEDQLLAAQEALRAMQLKLTPEHPDVQRQKRIVAELQKRADAEAAKRPASVGRPLSSAELARRNRYNETKAELTNLDRDIAAKTADEGRLRSVIQVYQRRIEAAPTREAELAELTRDYDTLQSNYKSLLSKKEDSQIAANLERRQIGEQFKILDPARLPERPSSPDRPRMYLLGIVSAFIVGLACAALAEYLDRSMRSEDDVRTALNLPVLATIPLARQQMVVNRRRRLAAVSAAAAAVLFAVIAVAWRLLR